MEMQDLNLGVWLLLKNIERTPYVKWSEPTRLNIAEQAHYL